ncbi:hypothetical protein EVG20_g4681 [Dentipellis fragilis]|uniref:F-box domain-containing protein n=1 Tax=Dentipellis fragilis TaxID=205917 RepID=A0A4Y9YVT3_9AGAM|nr:hypothetical protein EVG20_g4681 [Dentipellis fragilis]
MRTPFLLAVPREILEQIVRETALDDPVGIPSDVLSILLSCKAINNALSFATNKDLYARIFKGMFDIDAARRRFGHRALHSRNLASQFRQQCLTLKRIRSQDIYSPHVLEDFWIAFIMVMENDGKNREQLDWAGLPSFVNAFIRARLWEQTVNGWPVDSPVNTLALWLLWCTTDSASLSSESFNSHQELISLVLPFLIVAFKYPAYYAPDNHFSLPLPTDLERDELVSLVSVHGPFPMYRSSQDRDHVFSLTYYNHMLHLVPPPLPSAAKLLYFSRREMIELQGPPGMPVDRTAANLIPNFRGPTQEDLHDVNSHKGARFVPRGDWDWKSQLTSDERMREEDGTSHWGVGDSPKLLATSALWDNDWERLNNCWDPWSRPPLKGPVYTPGTLSGLWQGRMLVPDEGGYLGLVPRANFPDGFGEMSPFMSTWPIFMRLKEYHCVSPQVPVQHGGDPDDPLDDGIRNAWFPTVQMLENNDKCIVMDTNHDDFRTEHELYIEGRPNSHSQDTCHICGGSSGMMSQVAPSSYQDPELQTMQIDADVDEPQHADFEDLFEYAGLGGSSGLESSEDGDEYEASCSGIRDIIFTGETDPKHGTAWGRFTFLGRVRPWDGLVALVRLPGGRADQPGRTRWVFRGYIHYGQALVGSWRGLTQDIDSIPWEGPFVASRRLD